MKKDKVEIIRDWFIPWIMEDTSIEDAMSHEGSIESYALGIAGSIPINHIDNWEDVKHHWDNEPCNEWQRNFLTERGFDKWTDYYEDDGYVEGIPDTLEVKWIQSERRVGEDSMLYRGKYGMRYRAGMKVRLEDQVFEVIDECDNCKEGWETFQIEEDGTEHKQICQECDGLVDGSTTYQFQKEDGYIIIIGEDK